MPSHLIAEDTLHDSVCEYAALLDHFGAPEAQFCEQFATFVNEEGSTEDDVEYSPEVFQSIIDTAEALTQTIPDKDLEAIVNLVVYILMQQEQEEQFEQSVREWFTKLISAQQLGDKVEKNKKKTLRVLTLVSNLSSVYNLAVSPQLKKWLLTQILDLVSILDDAKILKPFVVNAESVVLSDDADEESRSLLVKASELYADVDELESLKLLQLAAIKISPASPDLIEQYIIKSLNSKTLDLTHITSNATFTQSASKELITLVEQYHTLPTVEFAQKADSFSQINTTTVINKNKILTLLSLAQNSSVLAYADIASALNIEPSQVELTLFDAIKRGALEGKMSQIQQEFHVHAVKLVVKPIGTEDWAQIKQKLLEHKKSLAEVKALIENVKKQKKN